MSAAKKRIELVVTSSPVDSTAARVMRQGDNFESARRIPPTRFHSDTPTQTYPFIGLREHDMTGVRWGSFVVIGWVGKLNPKKKSCWLVRCLCGRYEMRHANVMAKPPSTGSQCHHCETTLQLRSRSSKSQTNVRQFVPPELRCEHGRDSRSCSRCTATSFCGCCGNPCSVNSWWCKLCKPHVSHEGPLAEQTYLAQHGTACPFTEAY